MNYLQESEASEFGLEKSDSSWEEIQNIENSNEVYVDYNDNTINFITSDMRKIYDLALTKTIVYTSSDIASVYDFNFDGIVNVIDTSSIINAPGWLAIHSNTDSNITRECEGVLELFKANYADKYQNVNNMQSVEDVVYFFRNEVDSDLKAKYKYINAYNIYEKYMQLDENADGFVNEASDGEISKISSLSTEAAVGHDIDRLNSVDATSINSIDNNVQTTTGEYRLNKTTHHIKEDSIIKYKITVYNEGDYNSKDIEVVDYIPEGLIICDVNGNKVLSGDIEYTIGNKKYKWTVSENGRKATYKFTDTINKFDDENDVLDSRNAYILCCVDYVSITDGNKQFDQDLINQYVSTGEIFYNVSEITDSTPVSDDGQDIIYALDEDHHIGTTDTSKAAKDGNEYVKLKDRDSEENSLTNSSIQSGIIDLYETKFLNVYPGASNDTLKSRYEYQDDDDFERVTLVASSKSLDLALRKSITKVGDNSSAMANVTYPVEGSEDVIDRLPDITAKSVDACEKTGTGEYYHKKEAVLVNAGDLVEYTIRVYNEGGRDNYAGYAGEITDYLPSNIEFWGVVDADGTYINDAETTNKRTTDLGNGLGYWSWNYDASNHSVKFTANNTTAILPKENLNWLNMIDENSYISYYQNNTETFDDFLYQYQEIKVIGKVKENAPAGTPLTNVAEITKYVEIDDTANEVVISTDRDSTSNSLSTTSGAYNANNQEVNLDTYYFDRNVDDSKTSYYSGLEDDDDFETVVIRKGSYDFDLLKVDENSIQSGAEATIDSMSDKSLSGARFLVTQYLNAIEDSLLDNVRVNEKLSNVFYQRNVSSYNQYIVETIENGGVIVYEYDSSATDYKGTKLYDDSATIKGDNPFHDIQITNIKYADLYKVEELIAPDKYRINPNQYVSFHIVRKGADGLSYCIKSNDDSYSSSSSSNLAVISFFQGELLEQGTSNYEGYQSSYIGIDENNGNRINNEDGSKYQFTLQSGIHRADYTND